MVPSARFFCVSYHSFTVIDLTRKPVSSCLIWLARFIVAGTFLFSAFTKWLNPQGFEIYLMDQGLFQTRWMAGLFTRLLIGGELALGLAFMQPYYVKHVVSPVVGVLLAGFTVYLAYGWFVLDVTGDCGCFGEVVSMSPPEAITKNIFLLGLVAVLYPHLEATDRRWYVPGGILVIALSLTFVSIPLTSSPERNQFARFTQFEGAGEVDLLRGDRLVVVADAGCPHCLDVTKKLGEMKRDGITFPEVFYLIYGVQTTGDLNDFWRAANTRFPYRKISRPVFMKLLKEQLPTIYYLQNGSVEQVWDDRQVEEIKKRFAS